MTLAPWFWIIFVIAVIFGFVSWDRSTGWRGAYPLVLFVLIGLLGWAVFGQPVK